jgi:hypothetical protein
LAVNVIVEFADERRALAFEHHLKTGSGCAFAQRHIPVLLIPLPHRLRVRGDIPMS